MCEWLLQGSGQPDPWSLNVIDDMDSKEQVRLEICL